MLAAVPAGYYYASAQESTVPAVADPALRVEDVVDGLERPTTMAFLDQDTILVLEKDRGTVRVVENGVLQDEPLLDVAVANENERGMLGIAVSKENDTTTYVFLYFTESGGGSDGDDSQGIEPAGNRLYRFELENGELVNPRLLLDLPAVPGPRYNGGIIAIGPDDFVYVIIGDAEGHTTQAQNFEDGPSADGTSGILRIGKNGETPPSVIGTGEFGRYYFAYGIRNSFGMAFDPVTGALWDTENGPGTGDEINFVDPGFNSGWRDVFGAVSDAELGSEELVLFNGRSSYSNPEIAWVETIGPTALAFLNSSNLGEEYENDMFIGDINNGALYRFELNEGRNGLMLDGALADNVADTSAENEGITFGTGFTSGPGFHGITDIKVGPDGYLYVVSFGQGTIYRIAPENANDIVPGDDNNDTNGSSSSSSSDGSSSDGGGGSSSSDSSSSSSSEDCDNSYPHFCIPLPPPDLDCSDIDEENFEVRGSDPHGFDGDNDGVGCEDSSSSSSSSSSDDSSSSSSSSGDDNGAGVTINGQTMTLRDSARALAIRFTQLLDDDEEDYCFNNQIEDRNRISNVLTNILEDIYGDKTSTRNWVDSVLDRLAEDCLDDDDNGNGNNSNRP
jgi:glucose/arabinose dehydrogenase